MGSIIADRVKINSNSLIGAGSFVPFDTEIPENSLVMGSPAKVIKKIGPEHLAQIARGLKLYQDLAKRHLKSLKEIAPNEVVKR